MKKLQNFSQYPNSISERESKKEKMAKTQTLESNRWRQTMKGVKGETAFCVENMKAKNAGRHQKVVQRVAELLPRRGNFLSPNFFPQGVEFQYGCFKKRLSTLSHHLLLLLFLLHFKTYFKFVNCKYFTVHSKRKNEFTLKTCGQSYKQSTLVIWGIFMSGTTLES